MKIKAILLASLSVIGVNAAFAQGVEYDDMYFNSQDRAKLRAQRSSELAYNAPSKSKRLEFDDERENANVNPTDSYSARNVNPEYISRSHSQNAVEDEQEYFVNNYQYRRTNQYNDWNQNFNNWYTDSWYRNNYYGPAINNWYSPYYGYNSWNSPWYDPFWAHNGWSSSFSFHYGNSWNYSWGGNYNYWNRPYYGGFAGDPFYNPYYSGLGWYGGSYWNYWRNPGTIIIINDGERGRNIVHGRRPSRSSTLVSDRNNVRTRSNVPSSVRDNQSTNNGRVTQKQADYYNRYNRSTTPSSYDSRTNTQYNRSRNWDSGNNNSSWDNNRSMNRSSTPSYSPSRSSSSSGSSGARTNSGGSTSGGRGRD